MTNKIKALYFIFAKYNGVITRDDSSQNRKIILEDILNEKKEPYIRHCGDRINIDFKSRHYHTARLPNARLY